MKKLLAIVDDWERLERYAERFAPWYEVIEAPFGALGVELAREHASEIDQVLVDLTFEDMTEWEARELLRGDPKTARLPITWNPAVDRGVSRPSDFADLLKLLMA